MSHFYLRKTNNKNQGDTFCRELILSNAENSQTLTLGRSSNVSKYKKVRLSFPDDAPLNNSTLKFNEDGESIWEATADVSNCLPNSTSMFKEVSLF